MTYEEAYEEAQARTVTRKQVLRELEVHGFKADSVDVADFFKDHGDQPTYSGRAVLDWLGY